MRFLHTPVDTPIVITSGFGGRDAPIMGASTNHQGVDLRARAGDPVYAVNSGRVVNSGNFNDKCGWGVVIDHGGQWFTAYCHLAERTTIDIGKYVAPGDRIAYVGTTGTSTSPHLHFTLRRGMVRVDPTPRLQEIANTELAFTREAGKQLGQYYDNVSDVPLATSGISPYIFSNESFHPNIQYELTRRLLASETVNSYSPFIRLTSLTRVTKDNLPDGTTSANFPTLGIHGEGDVSFEDLYNPSDNRSRIGYATEERDGKFYRVPVLSDINATDTDPQNIPLPGIIDLKTDRSTSGGFGVRGGLFQSNIQIVAYSVGQVDALLKYFLRPSTRVVLELGRKSSDIEEQIDEFNWNRNVNEIKNELEDFIFLRRSQKDFLEKYVFDNFGRYDIYIGYVVKFVLKYTKENTYIIDLTIHSVQQFEIPTKQTGIKANCRQAEECKSTDIQEYFVPTYSYKPNTFASLMGEVLSPGGKLSIWKNHVATFTNQPKETGADSNTTNASNSDLLWGKGVGGYFVSWRFFVEVLLNDKEFGLLSVIPDDGNDLQQFIGTGIIRKETLANPIESAKANNVDPESSILSNEVGFHPSLRSIDPGTLIVYNSAAQNRLNVRNQERLVEQTTGIVLNSPAENQISSVAGDFASPPEGTPEGSSFLTNGVWLNTNAIIRAFTTADTVSAALETLLTYMNSAVEGYWNLQLLSDDTLSPGLHVIDYGLSKSKLKTNVIKNESPVDLFELSDSSADTLSPSVFAREKYMYVFNRKTQLMSNDDIGSETLEANVTFDLPLIIAAQAIAGVGGMTENSTLQSINVKELNDLSIIDLRGNSAICDNCGEQPVRTCPEINADPSIGGITSVKDTTDRINRYNSLGSSIRLVELDPPAMKKEILNDSVSCEDEPQTAPKTHAFNSSNLTKTVVDLTVPGIAGIQLFQSFMVARVPSILNRGYYMVTRIAHSFGSSAGWTTRITGRFRFNPME